DGGPELHSTEWIRVPRRATRGRHVARAHSCLPCAPWACGGHELRSSATACEQLAVADRDEVVPRAGEGDVQQIGAFVEEGQRGRTRDHAGEHDDASLPALEAVDRARRDPPRRSSCELAFLLVVVEGNAALGERATEEFELAAVGGDDRDVVREEAVRQQVLDELHGGGAL